MQKLVAAILIVSCSLLTGCAGTTATVKTEYHLVQGEKLKFQFVALPNINGVGSYIPNEWGIGLLNEALTKRLFSNGLLASEADTSVRTIEVTVTSFRLRADGARYFSGLVPESDNIQSVVNVKEQATGKVLSEFTVESKNSTNFPTREMLINDHADTIIATLKSEKR